MIHQERARIFGCCSFWCLFSQNCTSKKYTELLGNVSQSSLHCIGFCHEFCSQPYAINNDLTDFGSWFFVQKSATDSSSPVRFLKDWDYEEVEEGGINEVPWTKWWVGARCPPLLKNHEIFGNSGYRFSSFCGHFFLINPWKPEMMNFFWEISLTMMIMGSQWMGLWVDPRHPRHDEQKHPCKKGCLLSRNHREFLRTTEFLWVQEEFTFPLVHHYTLHCQQGIHSLPCVDMTRFDVLLLFAGGTNPWNHAWNKKFEVW